MKNKFGINSINEFKSFITEIKSSKKNSELYKKNIDIGFDENYGIYIYIDGITIAIDRWNPNTDIIFISHAHMDHIPNIPQEIFNDLDKQLNPIKFICSKITKEVAEARTRGKFTFPESLWLLGNDIIASQSIEYNGVKLTLINNGHTFGSNSLLIEGSEKILYTSDFITNDREIAGGNEIIKGLKPIKCDRLIMECTFGSPQSIFPSFREIVNDLSNYIHTQISEGNPVILLSYEFGKSQNILKILRISNRILLNANIAKLTRILEENGIEFPEWEPYGKYNKNQLKKLNDYILLTPPYSIFKEPYKSLIAAGAKVVSLSGKVLEDIYRKEIKADYYIPLSDHCDFNALCNFVKKCNPNEIYLEHGKIEEFSYLLSKLEFKQIQVLK